MSKQRKATVDCEMQSLFEALCLVSLPSALDRQTSRVRKKAKIRHSGYGEA